MDAPYTITAFIVLAHSLGLYYTIRHQIPGVAERTFKHFVSSAASFRDASILR